METWGSLSTDRVRAMRFCSVADLQDNSVFRA